MMGKDVSVNNVSVQDTTSVMYYFSLTWHPNKTLQAQLFQNVLESVPPAANSDSTTDDIHTH